MKLINVVLILGIYALQVGGACADDEAAIVGDARELKSDKLLYREYHYFFVDEKKHKVVYKDVDDNVIAEKSLDYQPGLTAPSLQQNNKLCGEELQVTHLDAGNELKIDYRPERNKSIKEKVIDKPETLVVDAGFNFFVGQHWEVLQNGDRLEFNYLVPSRLRTYRFKLAAVACEKESEQSCFEIAPDVWYLKLLVDPILLTYDNVDKKLIGFSGLGNIADEKCRYQDVDIRYQYHPNRPRF